MSFLYLLAPIYSGGAHAANITPVALDKQSVVLEESFMLVASISGALSNQNFFVKCRSVNPPSSTSDSQTYNPSTQEWLSDTSPWINMPSISVSQDGTWQGNIQCRIKSGTTPGTKTMYARACPGPSCTSDDSFQSSSSLTINSISPTSTPTSSPTVTPTPTLSPSNSPTPTNTPTKVPTAVVTKTPTPKTSKTPTPQPTEVDTVDEEVVSGNQATPTPTPASQGTGIRRVLPAVISLSLIGAGLALVSLLFIWKKRNALKSIQSKHDSLPEQ